MGRLSGLIRVFLTTVLLIASCGLARAQEQLTVAIEDFTLANGLRVVLLPNKRAPLVTHSIWYRVGAADEVPGKTGLAHFLEHLLFKGTTKFPKGEFDALMKANGAYSNATTTRDYTYYFQRIAADKLALVMELEADRMKNLVLTEPEVLPERDVVRQERLQRIESDPTGPFWEEVTSVIYGDHPYSRPVIGYMPEVEALTLDDALRFYRKYYQPLNAVVVVSGDMDVPTAAALARKFYGALRNDGPLPKRADIANVVPQPKKSLLELTDTRVQSPYVVTNYLIPSAISDEAEEALSLSFFGDIVGSGIDSKLAKALVQEQKLAADIGWTFDNDTRGPGSFAIYAVPNPGANLKQLEKALKAELSRILNEGVTKAEVDRVVRRSFGNLVYDFDSVDGFARFAGIRAMLDGDVKSAFDTSWWRRVTPASVNAAARKYLAEGNGVTAFLSRNATDMTGAKP